MAVAVKVTVGVVVIALAWYWGIRFAGMNVGANGNSLVTTAEEVSEGFDLSGKVYLVTGATTGLGEETARVLVLRGANVVVHGRSQASVDEAIANINSWLLSKGVTPTPAQLSPFVCDLSSTLSIKTAAANFKEKSLHGLILNAGIMALPERDQTSDGFESQMGVNHLGQFLLTQLLMPTLLASTPSRVVVLSSAAHGLVNMSFIDSPVLETSYTPWNAYGNSKMANVVFARELNRRYSKHGVTAMSVHPGGIMTNLGRNLKVDIKVVMLMLRSYPIFKSIPQGSATSVYAAISPEIDSLVLGGQYFQDGHVSPLLSQALEDFAADEANGQKLWTTSEKLLGIKF